MKLAEKKSIAWKPLISPQTRDFRRLRLARLEARTGAIRNAVALAASEVREDSSLAEDESKRQLANIVLSAYRILDPRRRSNLIERIQLITSAAFDDDLVPLPSRTSGTGRENHRWNRDLVQATPITPGFSSLGDDGSFKVLAVQDVMAIIWNDEKSAQCKRRLAATATFSSAVVLIAAVLISWLSAN